ncbi:POTRA domain-containing protein [Polaribacter sp. BAL334]|uniref:POTRA domain-containing protein n=1 Tax=Polaribacter sp. BAL334 TaxID=1708178 RepID=UPI0018D24353|nr:POTRA domain-containing protein [Polaribacter sp. BAL334]
MKYIYPQINQQLKVTFLHYIYVCFFLIISLKGFSQEFSLELISKNRNEQQILDKINYQKKIKNIPSINSEIEKISTLLKNMGYFTNTIDSIKKIDKKYSAFFSLNDLIEKAIIRIDSSENATIKNIKLINNSFEIKISELEPMLNSISETLDNEGKSFSKVQLKNIQINHKTLFADLEINPSEKRTIQKVIIKGYENFPTSFLKNYFRIKPSTIFNQKKIEEISSNSKNLPFIEEIKPPEVLFTKDSTQLFVYISKKQNNSIDGIVNFSSKENGGVLFNGMLDVRFQNIINTGERFEIFWNSIAEERQEFKITTAIPYIFNSIFSPEIAFSIYKQDSTFLNTNFKANLKFSLDNFYKLGIQYESESSENLEQLKTNNIETFSNNFYGIYFSYTKPRNDVFYFDKFHFDINPAFGRRKTSNDFTNQFKIKTTLSYIWDINPRNSLFIKNETGYLNSDTYLTNELFRIGGANSIRGFNEQSIFTESYTFFNIEYRILTNSRSYLYSITDFGRFSSQNEQKNALGFGIGYFFNTINSQININLAAGKNNSNPIDFKQVKLIVNWKNFF